MTVPSFARWTPHRGWRDGIADALPVHFDQDPRDTTQHWFPGIVALTDAPEGHGGFRCAPPWFRDPSRWPHEWSTVDGRTEYRPDVPEHEVVEVPLRVGDLVIFDSHLPHGTVRNHRSTARAVFYLQLHPQGTEADRQERLDDMAAGRCPPWWRWKPGHDQLQRWPLELSSLGHKLAGLDAWAERS